MSSKSSGRRKNTSKARKNDFVSPPSDAASLSSRKVDVSKSYARANIKPPTTYKSSTLNKADQLFDEIFLSKSDNPKVNTKDVTNTVYTGDKLEPQRLYTPTSSESSQEKDVEMQRADECQISPPKSYLTVSSQQHKHYGTRCSPRNAEKRPILCPSSSSPNFEQRSASAGGSSQAIGSSQNSLTDRLDDIQLNSPSKKFCKTLWKNYPDDKSSVDESLIVNVSDNEDRSELLDAESQKSSLSSTEENAPDDNSNLSSPKHNEMPEEEKKSHGDESEAIKRRPVYHHKWTDDAEEEFEQQIDSYLEGSSKSGDRETKLASSSTFTAKLKRSVVEPKQFYGDPVTQIKCPRSDKEMYTVVRNAKQAHQCLESGEAQQISDDIRYYLDNIRENKDNSIKCLSLLTLAQKCTQTNFRAHFRAYGYAKKLFYSLSDFHDDRTLALCASCIFYLLSRDRSSFPIDSEILNLALKFVHLDDVEHDSSTEADYQKYKGKIFLILQEWYQNVVNLAGFNQKVLFDVTEDNLSTGFLIIESLVFIFLRCQNELLKLSMCKLGGLDLLVKKFNLLKQQIESLPASTNQFALNADSARLLERYLRIINQVTQDCPKNQAYLIAYDDSSILGALLRFFHYSVSSLCNAEDPLDATDSAQLTSKTILSLCLKVLCNLTNMNEVACKKLGAFGTFLADCVELLVDKVPRLFKPDDRFDFSTLCLGLLINLIESCNANRKILISTKIGDTNALDTLSQMFLRHEAAASAIDKEVDEKIEIFQSQEQFVKNQLEFAQQVQETLETAAGQAGKHMEDSMIAAHIALLFGLTLQQNEQLAEEIKRYMKNRSFRPLIDKITKLVEFLRLINTLSNSHENAMLKATDLLERLSD